MADYQSCFKRYEIKFLLERGQRAELERLLRQHMMPDEHGESEVCNLYYDTPDYRLIRRSLEKPVYKEKLRLRSYGRVAAGDEIFLELKKKYKGVVYKRRVTIAEELAMPAACGQAPLPPGQIGREIASFVDFYPELRPRVYLAYRRDAYYSAGEEGLRMTLDRDIVWRSDGLSLASEIGGKQLLQPGQSLLEVKTSRGIPLWLVRELSRLGVYKCSFSKYGNAYIRMNTETKENIECLPFLQTCSPAPRRPA